MVYVNVEQSYALVAVVPLLTVVNASPEPHRQAAKTINGTKETFVMGILWKDVFVLGNTCRASINGVFSMNNCYCNGILKVQLHTKAS